MFRPSMPPGLSGGGNPNLLLAMLLKVKATLNSIRGGLPQPVPRPGGVNLQIVQPVF